MHAVAFATGGASIGYPLLLLHRLPSSVETENVQATYVKVKVGSEKALEAKAHGKAA